MLSPTVFAQSLDEINNGYSVDPSISRLWGNGSPYFVVNSAISANVPPQCTVTFAQVLSRHGARDPTAGKTKTYNQTIQKIKSNVNLKNVSASYAFLRNFTYTLGADQLSIFGGQELINSGIKFYNRYESLAKTETIFVRASGELRVVQSAANFTVGYQTAKTNGSVTSVTPLTASSSALPILVVSEDDGSNNTMNHGLCTAFENGTASTISDNAQLTFQNTFIPSIQSRLNTDLRGANFSATDTINLMDLCSFETVAISTADPLSPFCNLFTQSEWVSYDYYQSLGKWYGFGPGNPLGPTQGVGYTNELIARLTNTKVVDHTSTNSTLDNSNTTFPLGLKLYADFSHDNDMTSIMSAMGLFNDTAQLSNTTQQTLEQTNGYSATVTVPYSSRVYVEKMMCSNESAYSSQEELVRILVNDRVISLLNCGADELGRCTVTNYVNSLTFAKAGGLWDQCFTMSSTVTGTSSNTTSSQPKSSTGPSTNKTGNGTAVFIGNRATTSNNERTTAAYAALMFSFLMYL